MPSKMPPQLLALMEEFKARAAIAAQRNAADTTKHTAQITQHPPITAVDIERMKQELGLTADPNTKPFADGGAVVMGAGGALKNAVANQGLNVLTGEEQPAFYATSIPAMLALYHGAVGENEDAELAKRHGPANFYQQAPSKQFGVPLRAPKAGANNMDMWMHMMELRSKNPHIDSMTPEEKARALKNYLDYKQVEAFQKAE